ncbi:MAG: GNAT family N-acetyltransferase [Clostridia bacterium]|nr:GNAT family N-acetyltransferase [Clostridia bacterium]
MFIEKGETTSCSDKVYQRYYFYIDGIKIGRCILITYKDNNEVFLSDFVLEEQFQNKGYGTEILKKLISDYSLNSLSVDTDNLRAIHIYEKVGFEKIKVFREVYKERFYMRRT